MKKTKCCPLAFTKLEDNETALKQKNRDTPEKKSIIISTFSCSKSEFDHYKYSCQYLIVSMQPIEIVKSEIENEGFVEFLLWNLSISLLVKKL